MSLRCASCTLRLTRIQRHSLCNESEETLERIRRWVYPRDISDADYLCHTCYQVCTSNIGELPPLQFDFDNVCVACGRSIRRVRSRSVLREDMSERETQIGHIISEWIQPLQLQPSHKVCIPCWLRAQRAIDIRQRNVQPEPLEQASSSNMEEQETAPENQEEAEDDIQHEGHESSQINTEREIDLPSLRRAAATARHCLFFECNSQEKRRIPDVIRKRVIIDYNFYIPSNARICTYHIEANLFHELYAAENSISSFNGEQIEDIVQLLKEQPQLNFSNPMSIDDHLFKYWFGRTKSEYNDILSQVPRLNENNIKMGFTALLCKMRTGCSDERISGLFNVPRRTLEGHMDEAREILIQDYVPLHLGFNHLTREEIVARNSYLANHLFGNPEDPIEMRHIIVIADGTYLDVQKSSNYAFQKNTYSLHKYHNLVKPFLIVCCDGYIIEALGPYAATKNDASIMKDLIASNDLSDLFRENDIFILDRGFRDCVDDMIEKGYQVHMPETVAEGERQLTTLQANITRCVTMNRWVVEAVNGRFSRDFKIFRADYLNKRGPHIMQEFSIAAALINNFAVQFTERRNVERIINIIEDKIFQDNVLGQIVQENNLNMRHSMFHNITRSSIVFPELSIEDLELIALGTYQIKQARSYVGEHLRAHGMYSIEVATTEVNQRIISEFNGVQPFLLRAKIKSRHIGSRSYFTYIVVDMEQQGRNAILAYYCHCAAGKRTVGCCSHTMSILWYMGYARRQRYLGAPAAFLDDLLIM